MELLVVKKVSWEGNRVSMAEIGLVETDTNTWIVQPHPVPVIEVVDHLQAGDMVCTLFPTDFGLTPGPLLRVLTLADGLETIETITNHADQRTVRDMDTF